MTEAEKKAILEKVREWFHQKIIPNHLENTRKLTDPTEFNINPFLVSYLAGFLEGELTEESIAKALLYPRVLGTSITTSFGQNIQTFITSVLHSYGSTTPGIDIEFTDATDHRKKYCQVKLGPNTINKDDITTIHSHFRSVRNLGRTNNLNIQLNDLVVGILYGVPGQESSHYRALRDEHDYTLLIGEEFWYHLTGDKNFYTDLIDTIAEVAIGAGGKELLQSVISELSKTEAVKSFI